MDVTDHTMHTADNNIQRWILTSTSTQFNFQNSRRKETLSIKHSLRGPGEKYMSASEIEKVEESIIWLSETKVWKVKLEDEDSDFDCQNKSDGKPLHVDVDKGIIVGAQKNPTLPLNKLEEDENSNDS